MIPHFAGAGVTVYHGDCIEAMRELPDNSVHAVVTDPPYGLEFMGREWDSFKPKDIGRGVKVAQERAVEMTATGAGHSTSAGPYLAARVDSIRSAGLPFQTWCTEWAREAFRVLKPGGHMLAFGGSRTWHRLAAGIEDAGFEIRDSIAWLYGSGFPKSLDVSKAIDKAAGATREVVGRGDNALGRNSTLTDDNWGREWEGWGTALKPAFEPIVVSRKPLIGTVAANVLAHGTGALNIDATRIDAGGAKLGGGAVSAKSEGWDRPWKHDADAVAATKARSADAVAKAETLGRWPANVVLDETQATALDAQSGTLTSGKMRAGQPRVGRRGAVYADMAPDVVTHDTIGDSGGASRFFPTFRYEAKAPTVERPRDGEVAHPTVKPLHLMRWLVRLVTPKGGTVLEPFAGSGTTLEAALLEGFNVIGIEREADYLPLIVARITKPLQVTMFGDWEDAS